MRQQARLKGILGGTNTVGATTSSVPEQQQQQPAVVAKTSSSVDADDCNASASDASGLIVPERRTRSESDCDGSGGAFPGNSAGSSSNSSLSTRSLDSPSTSLEQVHPNNAAAAAHHASSVAASASWDSDVDVEPDTPDWSQGVPEDVLASLTNSEKKRQEVINELFHTERSHVRALKVLSQVFHRPMLETQVLPMDQIQLLFSNLDEMVTLHSKFNQAMKLKKKENPHVGDVGDLLLEMFDGEAGEVFEQAASTYCAKQQVALRALREQRRKDPKLNSFLNEVEANPMCRRLQLKDHILTGMLRLTKYPLLFDNLAKYTPEQNDKERAAVLRALERSREILSRVNQAVREAEDYHRLVEIQRTIDRATADRSAFEKTETVKNEADKSERINFDEIKNLDVTKRRLIYEGPLQWRLPKGKPLDLHVVLLDDTILLLHRQDDKYALKPLLNQNQSQNSVLSPVVKVSTVLVRHNAVDKLSLYLVNTSHHGAQIYDLVAPSSEERKLWYKHINDATEIHKADREGRKPIPQSSSSDDLIESPEDQLLPETPQQNAGAAASTAATASTNTQDSNHEARPNDKTETDKRKETTIPLGAEAPTTPQKQQKSTEVSDATSSVANGDEVEGVDKEGAVAAAAPAETSSEGGVDTEKKEEAGVATTVTEPLRLVTCTQSSLVDPVEVHVEERPVHIAEPVLTPIESLRRKDEIIKQALIEKQFLVSSILNIPRKCDEEVVDAEAIAEHLPKELINSAVGQTNQLIELMNSALSVSETDTVLATQSTAAAGGCEASGCPAPRVHTRTLEPAIPVSTLQPICNSLVWKLTQLLKFVNEWGEDRERLRKELRRDRERLHAIDAEAQRRETSDTSSTLPEAVAQSDHVVTSDTQEASNDGYNKEVTPNTQSAMEAASTLDDQVAETKVVSENEVMGDSVG